MASKARDPHPHSTFLHGTWLEPEELTYPRGGFTRRAFAFLRRNTMDPHPESLPYGKPRVVFASIPDTSTSIPAKLYTSKGMVRGFVSVDSSLVFSFTPEVGARRVGAWR